MMQHDEERETCFRFQQLMKQFRQYGLRVYTDGSFKIQDDSEHVALWHMDGDRIDTLDELEALFNGFEIGLKLAGKVTKEEFCGDPIDVADLREEVGE